jgi:hypothetical protein
MSELLVRVVDKINTDFYLNTKCTKRGDVIVVRPDGWAWGSQELANPEWMILRLPKVPIEEAEAMLGSEKHTDPTHPSKTLQRRAVKLDVDRLSTDGVAVINAPFMNVDSFRAFKVVKTPIIDPAMFGESHNIF